MNYEEIMEEMDNPQNSHPLQWKTLVEAVERSGLKNPDIWIEDVRRYGPCLGVERTTIGDEQDETDIIEASFSVITYKKLNRIIICHHF